MRSTKKVLNLYAFSWNLYQFLGLFITYREDQKLHVILKSSWIIRGLNFIIYLYSSKQISDYLLLKNSDDPNLHYLIKKWNNYTWMCIDIKTSTLDYNGERDLSSIINCVIFRLWGSLLLLLVCLPFDALAIEWLSLWCVYFHWLTDSVSAGGWFHRWLLPPAVGCDPNIYAGRLHISRAVRSMPAHVRDWLSPALSPRHSAEDWLWSGFG